MQTKAQKPIVKKSLKPNRKISNKSFFSNFYFTLKLKARGVITSSTKIKNNRKRNWSSWDSNLKLEDYIWLLMKYNIFPIWNSTRTFKIGGGEWFAEILLY